MSNSVRKLGALALALLLCCSFAVTAYATTVYVEGGTWDYGTKLIAVDQKQVYSNYSHDNSYHKASCTIGTHSNSSGWVAPGILAASSCIGSWGDDTHAYYDCAKG